MGRGYKTQCQFCLCNFPHTAGIISYLLSPTICGIFINDIVDDVNSVNISINIDGINVCILLYAEYIVFLSETEEGLQNC